MPVNEELAVRPLWEVAWGLGVRWGGSGAGRRTARTTDLSEFADTDWIVNSRNTADEEVVRTLASLVGFTPRVVHRIDSLELVEELIDAGRGVGLLPLDYRTTRRVRVLPLADPGAALRAFAVVRRGREAWPPLRLVLERLAED
jgi:DNA-binding transcriptional LysR family regulator